MRPAVPIFLTLEERLRLRGWRDATETPARLARRARIVLAASEGKTNRAIAAELSIDPETVALWRRRFSMNRLDGIRWDAPRAGRRPALPAELLERIERVPPHGIRPDGSLWTTRQLAHSLGISHMRVQRAWQSYRHGTERPVARSARAPGLRGAHQIDVAGMYLAPPGRAIIFRVEATGPPTIPHVVVVEPDGEPLDSVGSHSGWDGLLGALERWGYESASDAHRASSVQDLLVFLRALDASLPGSSELHVMLDAFSAEATRRIERWMQARGARFRRYRVPAGSTWSEAVDHWWARWPAEEKGGSTPRHVGQCVESLVHFLGRQNPAIAPFVWTPMYCAEAGLPSSDSAANLLPGHQDRFALEPPDRRTNH